jgi:S-formylglutathione hydrolase FrmB
LREPGGRNRLRHLVLLALSLVVLALAGLIGCVDQDGRWVESRLTYLDETHDVNIYLPQGYPAAAPYPVVYLLHGQGNTEYPEKWQQADVESQADHYDLVLVAVEGDDDDIVASWYSRQRDLPWPNGFDWRISFYDWFFEGVLPWVESKYDVRTDSGGRAIAGFSMGGKGALSLAGHRPDLFVAAAGIAGVMDLRDYADLYEVSDVYGPLAENEIGYAADSPLELAPNLKGLSITLLHGAEDTHVVHYEQSQRMSQVLNNLGYPHLWEKIPGQGHEPVSTYEITRTFESLAAAFEGPYSPPEVWHYRFANDTSRQVYDTTLTKTDPLTWTEIISVTKSGFETASGDAFDLTTAPVYTSQTEHIITITSLSDGTGIVSQVFADADGRLSFPLLAGRHRITITSAEEGESVPE